MRPFPPWVSLVRARSGIILRTIHKKHMCNIIESIDVIYKKK